MEQDNLSGETLAWRYDGGEWLFRNYTIRIKAGEVVGLMGPSGKGKSTLGKLLAGYMQPPEGDVTVAGMPIRSFGYRPVQLIHQHPELAVNPRWTIGKMLAEGWMPDRELLEVLGIEASWLSRYPNELSGGQLQRCCIARALGPRTRFLVADEMTVMLDAITQAEIWRTVLHIAESRGIGVLTISHDQPLLNLICDRIVTLDSIPPNA
ncbi:ABC transporter ATP-binding protein [Paenibacillus sp. strain BS8-2]